MKALVINCCPVQTGATAEIVRLVTEWLAAEMETKSICIDDYQIGLCKGCRTCHQTAACVLDDDVPKVMEELGRADVIVSVAPSYWADIPGQFKVFVDRCTPWSNTHEPHRSIGAGKRGYAIALRTGPGIRECERIIESLEHFYGHLEIEPCGHLGLTSVERKEDVKSREEEIKAFCNGIIKDNEKRREEHA